MKSLSRPLVSIITVFRNEERTLSSTLHSILMQKIPSWECIMINGQSSDRSAAIVDELSQGDSRFILKMQVSKGIANAFNEGLALAQGQFVIFLNGGDAFSGPDSLATMVERALLQPEAIHSFGWQCMSESGEVEPAVHPKKSFAAEQLLWGNTICHHSTLIPRQWFDVLGGYVPSLKIAMDYEFWLRALRAGVKFESHAEVVSYMRQGGVSNLHASLSRTEVVIARLINFGFVRKSIVKDFVQMSLVGIQSGWKSLRK